MLSAVTNRIHWIAIFATLVVTPTAVAAPYGGELPFDSARSILYDRQELLAGYSSVLRNNRSVDWKIFQYYHGARKFNPSFQELLAQRSHDAGMDFAINRFFEIDDSGFPKAKKIVVIMGSHSILRSDSRYAKIALLARTLSKAGYFIVTGGGPGLMEAAHLGAYLSGEPDGVLQWALQTLSLTSKPVAGSNQRQYEMADFWTRSQEVIKQYPHGQESLGIPTWFYGHEGANAFSTHIAKYFSNALREEKICSIGFHGAIFADGGPGTFQEISMVAAENGYASYNWYKPMVIFSEKPEAQLMKTLIVATTTPAFKSLEMLTLTSDIDSTVEFIRGHPPAHKNEHLPLSRGHLRQPSRQ